MKWILALGMMMAGTAAHANEGVTKAREFCRYLGNADLTNSCLKVLRDADYIDPTTVDICRYLGNSEKTIACFKAVRDRKFEESELTTCRYMGNVDKTITCLESTGRRGSKKSSVRFESRHEETVIDEDDVPRIQLRLGGGRGGNNKNAGLRNTLKRALEAVRSGDNTRAEALLEAAIDAAH